MASHRYPLEPLFGRILSPFEQFLRRTTAGGTVLMTATVVALGLATVLGAEVIHHFWERPFTLSAGDRFRLELSWGQWVNDGLMALFFLLVGLELKREILVGELSSLKDAALPVVGAAGGMIIPQLRETAAWLASTDQETFQWLLRIDPVTLLRTDEGVKSFV